MVVSYKPLPDAEKQIYEKISDITISMKSVDYLDMPECIINEVPVYMSSSEQSVYDDFREDMVTKLKDDVIDAANAAVLSGKLLQMLLLSMPITSSQNCIILWPKVPGKLKPRTSL